jgi:hypothetical protein
MGVEEGEEAEAVVGAERAEGEGVLVFRAEEEEFARVEYFQSLMVWSAEVVAMV